MNEEDWDDWISEQWSFLETLPIAWIVFISCHSPAIA